MTPFYQRLPEVAGFNVGRWVDPVGLSLTGLTAAAVVAHGVIQTIRHKQHVKSQAGEDKAESE
jgi:Ni,Fe-hydrogenase I small subunit